MENGDILGKSKTDPSSLSREHVDLIFKDFIPKRERGGYTRTKPPHVSGNSVETSFSPEQMPFVRLTMTNLNAFAQGEILGSKEKADSFEDLVISDFLNQRGKLNFTSAIDTALKKMLEKFCDKFPGLTPALKATILGGGADGIAFASSRVFVGENQTPILSFAIASQSYTDFKDAFAKHPQEAFIQERSRNGGPAYEVWCLGQGIANTLEEKIQDAAWTLSQKPEVKLAYFPDLDSEINSCVSSPKIKEYAKDLYEKARSD